MYSTAKDVPNYPKCMCEHLELQEQSGSLAVDVHTVDLGEEKKVVGEELTVAKIEPASGFDIAVKELVQSDGMGANVDLAPALEVDCEQ